MPALPTVVTDYLDAITEALTTGPALDNNVPPATHAGAQNYLRAQDMATVLDLLQGGLEDGVTLTCDGAGTTLTLVDATAGFVAGEQIGQTVLFDAATTTAALRGVTARVVSNTTTTLTFADYLPAAVVATDTYSIQGTMFSEFVEALREGKSLADAPAGSVYGANRLAIGGLVKGIENLGAAVAERNIGRPGLTSLAGSTDTVVILADSDYRIDQFKGMRVVVTARGEGFVVSNDENSVTLRGPMAAAAQAGDAVAITVPVNDFGGTSAPKILTHPGAQPGENAFLASLIAQLQALVVAVVLPA